MRRRHPDWLKVALPTDPQFLKVRQLLQTHHLHTVCQSAKCPNQSECFSAGTATFLIMGDHCTRNCRYCNVHHGEPMPLDPAEPNRIAEAVSILGVDYVVITSVTRDDLPDFGAGHFGAVVSSIRAIHPGIGIELLIPDFQFNFAALESVVRLKPTVLNHNIEVVERLFPQLRPEGDYHRSLQLFNIVSNQDPTLKRKSGLMVGLGETMGEIRKTLLDLYGAGVQLVTVGQYLQPRKDLHEIVRYYTPDEFLEIEQMAKQIGFQSIIAGPLVRSSYHAKNWGMK